MERAIIPWRPQPNNIYCMDALSLLRSLPDASVDLIATDPPYGIGVDKWDVTVSPSELITEFERVLARNGFLAFTLTMPELLNWLIALQNSNLSYKDQVIWLKRGVTVNGGLFRTFENLMIYGKGNPHYVNKKGLYSDVRVPGLQFDAIAIEGIQRHISDLNRKIATNRLASLTSTKSDHLKTVHAKQYNFAGERSPRETNFTNVWSFLPHNKSKKGQSVHPTQKPVLLLERLVSLCTHEKALVVDPFMGSGTTAIAARNLGRDYIGCDMSAEYVQIANQRLQETDPFADKALANGLIQKSLFDEVTS